MRSSLVRALVFVAVLGPGSLGSEQASAAAPPPATASDARRLRAEAERLADKARYREAIPFAEALLSLQEERAPAKDPLKIAAALELLADLLVENSELSRAEALYNRALALREQELGAEHPLVADVLHGLTAIHLQRWSFRRAEGFARRALAIRERAFGAESLEVAAVRLKLGAILRDQNRFDLAREELEKALAIRERQRGSAHPELAEVLDELGELDCIQDRLPQAKERFERALSLRDKAFGTDSLGSATTLLGLAWVVFVSTDDVDPAILLTQRALDIREKALGSEHIAVALARGELGWLHHLRRDRDAARTETIEALRVLGRVLGDQGSAQQLVYANNLIDIYAQRGEYRQMAEAYARASKLAEAAEELPILALSHSLCSEALVWRIRGEYARAEALVRRAHALVRERLGEGHHTLDFVGDDLALILNYRGDYAAANSLMSAVIRHVERRHGASSAHLMSARLNVAFSLLAQRDATRAKPLFRAVATVAEQKNDSFSVMARAYAYDGLSFASLLEGNVSEARTWMDRTLPLFRQIFPEHSRFLSRPLWTLSSIHLAQGQAARAEEVARQAFAIDQRALGDEHPELARYLDNLGAIVFARGQLDEAMELMRRSADLRERHAQRLLAGGSEEQRRALFTMLQDSTDAAISLHVLHAPADPRAADLALTVILRRKGRVIDAMGDTFSRLRRHLDPEARGVFQRLREVQREIAMTYTQSAGSALSKEAHARVQALEVERQDLERDLATRSAEFEREHRTIELADLRAAIPRGGALVELVAYRPFEPGALKPEERWGKRRYAAYVLHRNGKIALADLGEGARIDAAVERFRRALSDPLLDPRAPGRALDALVMAPLRPLLGQARVVFVSPDGALNLVPFGALVDEKGRYLLEAHDFTYLTSGRDLMRMAAPDSSLGAPVIFADPAFGPLDAPVATDKQRGLRSAALGMLKFPRLPETAMEAHDLVSSLPRARVLLGKAASEGALKALRSPRILHLATHGFFLPSEHKDKESSLEGEAAGRAELARENRLLRSGLALSGANARKSGEDDGILTALEASGLDLEGTKLVTLSACEAAVGEVSDGDGVYGLRRALFLAGAETQVLSLWRVDDEATRQLMAGYYRALSAGAGRSEAMREVALSIRENEETKHPYFWAGFIVSGNWRSLDGREVVPKLGRVAPGPRGCACEVGAEPRGEESWLLGLLVTWVWRKRRRLPSA